MLAAPNRLAKRADIERVFKRGRSAYAGELGLRAAKNNLPISRFSVVASLKVSKKAVERNTLKRRLREIVRRDILPQAKAGYDGILLTKKGLLAVSYEDLRALTIKLFKKARLI